MLTVSDYVKSTLSRFEYYREGYLYYMITVFADTEEGIGRKREIQYWIFPIPIDDTKGATFKDAHKSIDLMRWIRKAIKNGTMVRYYPKGGQQVNSIIASGND